MKRWILAAAAAAGAAAPGAAQEPPELARFEAAFEAGRHEEAARLFDQLVDTRRLRAGAALAPDPLLSGLAGRLYLRRGQYDDYAIAYLEQAQHASVPAAQRRAAAIALAEAQTRTGDRRAALAVLQRLDRGGMSAGDAAAAALAEARALLVDDPRAALARVQPLRATTDGPAAFEAEMLAAQAHSLLGDPAAAAAAADRAWTLSAALPAHHLAPLRIALVRAALAAERGDHAAAAAMLNVGGAGATELAPDASERIPVCGDGGLTPSDHATFAVYAGGAGGAVVEPVAASRPAAVAPFLDAVAGADLLAQTGAPASGTVLTLRCRAVPDIGYPADMRLAPFARWFAARGLFFSMGARSTDSIALRIGEAEQRLGADHHGLIPLRADLGTWLGSSEVERGEEMSFETQALQDAVTAAMRRIGGADEAIGPPALERLHKEGSAASSVEEAIRRHRAGAPAVLDLLTPERGYAFLIDWLATDADLPGDIQRPAIERLAARFPMRSADPRRRALRMRLGALLHETGDGAAARSAFASAGAPAGSCIMLEDAPTFTEGAISDDDFPPLPLENGMRGLTVAEYGVGADGQVTSTRVILSAPAGLFDAVTAERIGAFRFAPGRSGGRPAACTGRSQRVIWRLPDSPEAGPPATVPAGPPRRI